MLRKRLDPAGSNEDDDDYQSTSVTGSGDGGSKDRTAVLAIAYHNMGVEQEFLRSYPAAILSYKKAVNFAEKHLGVEDGITQNLRNVYENAKNEVSYNWNHGWGIQIFENSWMLLCSRRAKRLDQLLVVKEKEELQQANIIKALSLKREDPLKNKEVEGIQLKCTTTWWHQEM